LHLGRWKDLELCNVVPSAASGEDGGILARGRPGLAGKGWESGVGSPRVPFRWLEGSKEVPAVVLGGALHPWPLLPWFRRGDRLWSWFGGRGRCRGVAGRLRCAQRWGRELSGGIAMAEWTEENNEHPTASRRRRARRGKRRWLRRALVFIVHRARRGTRSREAAAGVCRAVARGARMRAWTRPMARGAGGGSTMQRGPQRREPRRSYTGRRRRRHVDGGPGAHACAATRRAQLAGGLCPF
jgi:hypothetical protein